MNLIFPPLRLPQISSRFFNFKTSECEEVRESEWIAQKKHNKISWVKNEVLMKIDVVYLWLFRASSELLCISERIKKIQNKTEATEEHRMLKKYQQYFSSTPHFTATSTLPVDASIFFSYFFLFKIHFPKWKTTFVKGRNSAQCRWEFRVSKWDEMKINNACVFA